ncbi:hypothetical protein N7468_002072 [Penicillium chermesinum]|uniref:U3 small nucleolar RNA-associated protein 11 n=1 Tax=Penicillium chermesinum TaxID=63820 RepID=A0A9W9TZ85_9EURO|nr:uncharacterized protein N7468_002072 [Penicillium chermesinum]KAJ5247089.1 hypothetical protein N7468_002072 [Penicillium chermesinum]KAJ6145336.1 hypothetical protein N7470_009231 [Penicillium chermesinum]
MSSMRNAVQRRNHRERGQLEGREKWGILEKHKDYSLRAKDYNEKKAKLKRLEEKALNRNPDEFHFGMMGDRNQKQGKHGRGNVARPSAAGLSHEAIKLLKTQDKGYLKTQSERIRREIERLESDAKLQKGMDDFLGVKSQEKKEEESEDEFDSFDDLDDLAFGPPAKKKARKIVFADDKAEQQDLKRKRSEAEEMEAMDEDSDESSKKVHKTPKQIAAERKALVEARRARYIRKRTVQSRENKLKALRKQFAELQAAERELDWQRAKMDNSVGGTNKNGVKWKVRERKR